VQEHLAASPIDPEQLRDHFEEMRVDLQQIERLRPTKKVQYDFSLALPNIQQALRLIPKVARTLFGNELDANETPALPTQQQQFGASRKIPELLITSFDGDVIQYASFIKSFHLKYDNLNISDSERLQHLKTNVVFDSAPFKMINNLELTDANYTLALQTLNEKYNNPARVISELYHRINHQKRA